MRKIWLIFNVLVFTAMTTGVVSALEKGVEDSSPDMIERHDQDGDGRVSISEFPGPDKHFNRIDQDGNGFIDQNEAPQSPRPKGKGRRVPGKFQEDDVDGNGVVSRTEFSGPADHFERLDRNGDGAIQESEARQGPPDMKKQGRGDR